MVWSIRALLQMRGFDSRCNASGGQEDTEMLLRLFLSNPQSTLSNSEPALVYNDTRFNDMSPDALPRHTAKIDHELSSIRAILERLRQDKGNSPFEMDFVW